MHKFSFYKPFSFKLSFDPYFEQNNIVFDSAHFALNAAANLNKFDLPGAFLNLKNLLLEYKETTLKTQAKISNFENPAGTISVQLKNLSDGTLADFTEVPPFKIPLISTDISFDYFIKDSKANIKKCVFTCA